MNSKEIFEKINQRNKYVVNCGTVRNSTYFEFQKASCHYDTSKKGFYTAIELARIDENIPEDELERYEHLVKHFDKQLLNQLKDRKYNVLKIQLENEEKAGEIEKDEEDIEDIDMNEREVKNKGEIEKDDEEIEGEANGKKINNHQSDALVNRILNIQSAGYERNRFHFEFVDSKQHYQKAKMLFYKETSLALQDGLITEIEEGIYIEEMKKIEAELDDKLGKSRYDCLNKRKLDYDQCRGDGIRGRGGRGRGGRGRGGRGRGGRGRGGRGRGGRGRRIQHSRRRKFYNQDRTY